MHVRRKNIAKSQSQPVAVNHFESRCNKDHRGQSFLSFSLAELSKRILSDRREGMLRTLDGSAASEEMKSVNFYLGILSTDHYHS